MTIRHTLDWRLIGYDNTEGVVSDAYGPVARVFHADRTKAEFVGNLALIAAAPVMADVLQDAIARYDASKADPAVSFTRDETDLVKRARAALRAAGRLP